MTENKANSISNKDMQQSKKKLHHGPTFICTASNNNLNQPYFLCIALLDKIISQQPLRLATFSQMCEYTMISRQCLS